MRQVKTILGDVEITENRAEEDLQELTGIKISPRTLPRLVKKQEIEARNFCQYLESHRTRIINYDFINKKR